MKYDYAFVPVSQWLTKKTDDTSMGQALANHIKDIVQKLSNEGWEYYRSDSYTVNEKPGCLAVLFGAKEQVANYNLLVFRKEKQNQ